MGQLAGMLWMVAAVIGAVGAFLPGAHHAPFDQVLALCAVVFGYGVACTTLMIPWSRITITAHAIWTAVMIPVIGLAMHLMGSSLAYVEPLLVVPLLYSTLFFPRRLAWLLTAELLAIAGLPLLTDPQAVANAYVPRYLATCIGFLTAAWVTIGLRERLSAAESRQREIANTDPLTGVRNRRWFGEAMERELADRCAPADGAGALVRTPLSVLIIDLDDFKRINDRHGHSVGDAVLCAVADSASVIVRSSDTLARIGGDEFAVILPGAHGDDARELADLISAGVSGGNSDLPPHSVSVGWAVFPDDGADYATLLRLADLRMMRTKRHTTDIVTDGPDGAAGTDTIR